MRVGVVGHVEMVEFAVVDAMPAAGEIVHARETFVEPAGGGAVAAVVLRELADEVTFWTAVGSDALGDAAVARLERLGVDVRARRVDTPTRRCFTHLCGDGERTITVIGPRLEPDAVDVAGYDAVYVTAATPAAMCAARAARVLVATPRTGPVLREVPIDVLVASARDSGELIDPALQVGAVVRTSGDAGGSWSAADGTSGTWQAAPLPGAVRDAYGCGDAFAATLTHQLAQGATLRDACGAAAVAGARRATLRGPYGDSTRASAS